MKNRKREQQKKNNRRPCLATKRRQVDVTNLKEKH